MADDSMKNTPGMKDMAGTKDTAGIKGMDTPAPPVQAAGKTVMRESMTNMPMATPKRVWTVTGTEDWAMLRGFGSASGMVSMMNSMMVGGSPMQHMKMGKMDVARAELPAPTPEQARQASAAVPADTPVPTAGAYTVTAAVAHGGAVVGDNPLAITVTDASGKPVMGLKLAATVAMVTMDMGTAHPVVTEIGGGRYVATVNFSMAGPWRLVISGDGGKVKSSTDFQAGGPAAPPASLTGAAAPGALTLSAALSPPPQVGSPNTLTVTVRDAAGKPVAGAKVTSSVAMTTMDMGTTHPAFSDIGGGSYESKVGFSMAGPWRVVVHVAPPGGSPQTQAFDFTAK